MKIKKFQQEMKEKFIAWICRGRISRKKKGVKWNALWKSFNAYKGFSVPERTARYKRNEINT